MTAVFRRYLWMLEKHPTKTMSLTTGTLMCTGDLIAQLAIEKNKYDPVRSARFLGFGILLAGPILRGWYFLLDRIYKGSKFAPIKMMLTDQGIFAPSFNIFFLCTMGLLKQNSFQDISHRIKRDYIPILKTNYKVWPIVQLTNFYFVPLQHRVLVVNVVALWWNTYLAWKSETQLRDKS